MTTQQTINVNLTNSEKQIITHALKGFDIVSVESILGKIRSAPSGNEHQMSQIDKLRDLIKVQCSSGNWDYSPYMLGMANGMIVALSVFTGEEPEFLARPTVWLQDKPDSNQQPVAVGPQEANHE